MLAGIIFPRGFYCPGETWNAKNHPADRQGKGASCMVVVGDEVWLCQKVGQQMPREIIDRVHPSVILVKIHSQLASDGIRPVFPKPHQSHRMERFDAVRTTVMIQKLRGLPADGTSHMFIFNLHKERHFAIYQIQHILKQRNVLSRTKNRKSFQLFISQLINIFSTPQMRFRSKSCAATT